MLHFPFQSLALRNRKASFFACQDVLLRERISTFKHRRCGFSGPTAATPRSPGIQTGKTRGVTSRKIRLLIGPWERGGSDAAGSGLRRGRCGRRFGKVCAPAAAGLRVPRSGSGGVWRLARSPRAPAPGEAPANRGRRNKRTKTTVPSLSLGARGRPEMPLFPQISLRPEVERYLRGGFVNQEVVSAGGKDEAERKFETLLKHLSHPPSFTTVRVNTHVASVQYVKNLLLDELHKQYNGLSVPVLQHPDLWDVLLIPVIGPRQDIERRPCEVVVGAQCGNAVLRGAHVYVPGVLSASAFMKAGDTVSVYSDIQGKCKKGAKEFDGTKVFLGNGVSELSRREIFSGHPELKGIGIRMTEPVYRAPSFDGVLPGCVFLQNLPSAVVAHVLDPQPGEKILDLCAAPGGKTTHIAALMRDEGKVIALDKIANKVEKIKQNALSLGLNCIRAFCFDGTKALTHDMVKDTDGEPPFPPESFDRVLLDAPCSGLGQRPNMACTWTLKEVTSYQPLQRKLFTVAVRLLKAGGVLVYSTCSVTLAENEEQVAWALARFPCLQLQPQEPQLGGAGMMGAGLSSDQRKQLQRFDPAAAPLPALDCESLRAASLDGLIGLANKDCIGFFIAKFRKRQSTGQP